MPSLDIEKTALKARAGLKKIQRSGDGTKKFYLVLLSSLAMIIVVGLWLFYLNVTLPDPAGREALAEDSGKAISEAPAGDSFFTTITRGARVIFEDLKSQFAKIGESLTEVKEFSLEGKDRGFVPAELSDPNPLP